MEGTVQDRDHTMEEWLRNTVAPTYDAMQAGQLRLLSADELRSSLQAKRKHRK